VLAEIMPVAFSIVLGALNILEDFSKALLISGRFNCPRH
jgi:hypothetical protein